MPPTHILNAPTKLMKDLGYGKGYDYDHDPPKGFSGQNYFPDGMERRTFYQPASAASSGRSPSAWTTGRSCETSERRDVAIRNAMPAFTWVQAYRFVTCPQPPAAIRFLSDGRRNVAKAGDAEVGK